MWPHIVRDDGQTLEGELEKVFFSLSQVLVYNISRMEYMSICPWKHSALRIDIDVWEAAEFILF